VGDAPSGKVGLGDTWAIGAEMAPGALKTEQAVRGAKEPVIDYSMAWKMLCRWELLWGDSFDLSFRPSMPCWHGV
jgi:hypothetical protein